MQVQISYLTNDCTPDLGGGGGGGLASRETALGCKLSINTKHPHENKI